MWRIINLSQLAAEKVQLYPQMNENIIKCGVAWTAPSRTTDRHYQVQPHRHYTIIYSPPAIKI